jgi:hypothetical protein
VRITWFLLPCVILASGCKSPQKDSGDTGLSQVVDNVRLAATGPNKLTPATQALGKIVLVNAGLRYVVIDVGVAGVPKVGERMQVFRGDERVGEVRISKESSGSDIAADIILGELQVGDQVRAQ